MKTEQNSNKISNEQHEDFIWTWKSNGRGNKVSIWLPYFSDVKKSKGKANWLITYNGGDLDVDLNKVDFILFYGASGSLSLEFLDALSTHKIIFIIHRRNMVRPYIFFPSNTGDSSDVLTKQILYRSNLIQRTYIARTLIHERFVSIKDTKAIYDNDFKALGMARSVDKIRGIEAYTTARYWKIWFSDLGIDEKRRSDNVASTALNALSNFLYGILLRWILFHKLSPCHGYLHVPTDYPSLAYDLMEPYRYLMEKAVKKAYKDIGGSDENALVAASLANIKDLLEETVYVPTTRQYVRRKNLLHGIVLALRAYLTGEAKRMIIPTEGRKNGGRPPKCGYKLPGEIYKKK